MVRRLGGGILALVAVAVPVILDKMDIHLTTPQGTALLIACGLLALIGVIMAICPERKKPTETPMDQRVTSHNQSGGITAHTVSTGDDKRS